jgi:hypothetical protein
MRLLKILLVSLLVVGGLSCAAWAAADDAMNFCNLDEALLDAQTAKDNSDPTLAKQAAEELNACVSADMSSEDYYKVMAALEDLYGVFGGDANVLASIRKGGNSLKAVSGAIPGATPPADYLTTPPGQTKSVGWGQGGTPPGASVGQGGGGGGSAASPK